MAMDLTDADVVIAFKSEHPGILMGTTAKVFVKDGEEMRQVGFVQSIDFRAHTNVPQASAVVSFPASASDESLKTIMEYSGLLVAKGCSVTVQ